MNKRRFDLVKFAESCGITLPDTVHFYQHMTPSEVRATIQLKATMLACCSPISWTTAMEIIIFKAADCGSIIE